MPLVLRGTISLKHLNINARLTCGARSGARGVLKNWLWREAMPGQYARGRAASDYQRAVDKLSIPAILFDSQRPVSSDQLEGDSIFKYWRTS